MSDTTDLPQIPVNRDRIYPRCVWCFGEQYALAVLAYSRGDVPCAASPGCGRHVPEAYRRDR